MRHTWSQSSEEKEKGEEKEEDEEEEDKRSKEKKEKRDLKYLPLLVTWLIMLGSEKGTHPGRCGVPLFSISG